MPRIGVRAAFVIVSLTLCLTLAAPWRARAATPEEVEKAIKRGVEYLYSVQNEKGNWETVDAMSRDFKKEPSKTEGGQYGGLTALATYALLDCGETWRDERVRKPIEWLHKSALVGTYAVAFRAQVWQYLPQSPAVKSAAQRDAGMLLSGMKTRGDARGFWSYFVSDHNTTRYDHSCSQIALLGIWACQQAGREVPQAFWKEAELAWAGHQLEDGAWSYVYKGNDQHGQPKMTMTLAGVATLFITQDYVHIHDGIACKGNLFNDRLVKGTQWIHDHFNEGLGGSYGLYGFERVAVASGYKFFGEHDWYKQGTRYVIGRQQQNGGWGSIPETAFSLLFLSRGRQPVIINKFQYDLEGKAPVGTRLAPKPKPKDGEQPPEGEKKDEKPAVPTYPGNWCQRPRDAAAFARWMGSALERKLNWQIVSSQNEVDDWFDAPVLWMAGNQKLDKLPAETVSKLKQYIEEGGVLVGHADCGSKEFTDAFIKLGHDMFPQYEFRELPAAHPIFTLQQFQRRGWKNPPSVKGLSNGARELMLILPETDLARHWQLGQYKDKPELFQVMNGIVLYAADRQNLKYKGGTHVVRTKPDAGEVTRKITVARLQWAGNWDPEPAGWRRLAAILKNQKQATLVAEPVKLGEGKLDPAKYPLAHLTGTGNFSFTKEQLNELRKYAIKGGVLICDAAGGSGEFADTAQKQLEQIITGAKMVNVPPEDPALAAIKEAGAHGDPLLASVKIKPGAFEDAATQPATQATTRALIAPPGTGAAATDGAASGTGAAPAAGTGTGAGAPAAPDENAVTPGGSTSPKMPAMPPLPPPVSRELLPKDEPPPEPVETAPAGTRVTLPGKFPVEYRKFARTRLGDAQTLRLKGVKFRNKWTILYSAEDLSTGLVGQHVDGIYGYTPGTATEVMRRLLLNLGPKTAPPDQPSGEQPKTEQANPEQPKPDQGTPERRPPE